MMIGVDPDKRSHTAVAMDEGESELANLKCELCATSSTSSWSGPPHSTVGRPIPQSCLGRGVGVGAGLSVVPASRRR